MFPTGQLRLVDAGVFTYPAGETVPAHSHATVQLVYAVSGVLRTTTPNGAWVLPPSRALLVPAGQQHGHRAPVEAQMHTLHLDGFPAGERPRLLAITPLARELISALARNNVELCHPEVLRELRHREFPEQWHLHATEINQTMIDAHANVTPAWETTKGRGIVVAIIDDGVDVDHKEFSTPDKIAAPHSFSGPRVDDARPGEGDNHGTACSGVAVADGAHGGSGVAPEAKLMPLRMVSGLGSQDESDAFVWAADNGADVISCSWGPRDGAWWDPDDPTHHEEVPLPDSTRLAIDYATNEGRGGKGCVITWAAGNGNESVDNDGYASYERVIAVAACNDQSTKSAYSDHGRAIWCSFPSSHGEPSLTPGIWTTDRSGHDGYNSGNPSLGDAEGDYTNSFGGTSSACPGVAGVAALVLAVAPDLSWDQVKDILRRSCDRIDEAAGGYDADGHSHLYGFGRINAATAVNVAKPA
jgi:subtilisin family serine protease